MSTDTALYDYDNEGQLSSKQEGETTTYSFDKAYRLTGIGADTFAYDGAGNRLRAVRGGVETRYIYDANGNLLAEADANNVITRYYVHGSGLLAAITPVDAVYCYHYNATGNTVAITDSSETVVNSYDYSPFGMIISESEGFAQPFKYVGRLGVMSEGDFYYMRARYYDPLNGRFISEDPLGFDGGDVNLYVYGSNAPTIYSDSWGLSALAGALPIAGGFAAGDGPLPIGDLIGAGIILGAGVYDAWYLIHMQEAGTIYVDPKGNAIPTPSGGSITGSPDGKWIQGRDPQGNPTGVRIDGPHNPVGHPDPRAQSPHAHVPGVTNPDGTPWLPVKREYLSSGK